ncbi:restriction endonuclease subunit S [Clostridium sp.]|uniref:restriction endonuclease subunit S n=1 Tax=Clostridium sp. TaxID=1506 RepID=UPI00260ACF86|nr:restriction endonuclease subunit S [Clostridium sp.]
MSSKVTLFGEVPDDWVVSEIGEIAELRQGLQISKKLRVSADVKESIPLLKITDLPSGIFSEYVKDIPENYIASKDDIIYTRTGQVGLVYTNIQGCVHNNCFKVILDYNNFDKDYIYYYLNSKTIWKYSNSVAGGSVQKDLTHGAFKKCLIAYPKLDEQRSIGKILSSLDKKIETNNQINKKLEEMAQAIFKQWFVDFEFPSGDGEPYKSSGGEMVESEMGMIPKGWEVKNITELVDSVSIKHKFDKNEIIFLNTSDIFNGEVLQTKYSEVSTLPGQAKKSIKKDDILYSEIRPQNRRFAYVDFVADDYVVSTKLMVLRAKTHISSAIIYFLLTNSRIIDELQMIAESRSGTFPQITFNNLKDIKIAVPKDNSLNDKLELFQSILNKMCCIRNENKKLNDIRDNILPKLMSGEIRVPINN